MNFKKDKAFTAIIAVLGIVLIAGLVLCAKGFVENSNTKSAIAKTEGSLKRLLSRKTDFALTEKNVEIAEANKKKINDAKGQKVALLKGAGAEELVPKIDSDAGAFISSLLGSVNNRVKSLKDKKIVLGDDAAYFGFARYLSNGQQQKPPAEALPLLALEQNVIQLLSDKLVDARTKSEEPLRGSALLPANKNVFLLIKDIRREAGELPKREGMPSVSVQKDELMVLPVETSATTGLYRLVTSTSGNSREHQFPSLRRANTVKAVAFQIGFIAPTSVLRNFIAEFSDDGKYPVYVRDISVRPAPVGEIERANAVLNPTETLGGGNAVAGETESVVDSFAVFGTTPAPAGGPATTAAPAVPQKLSIQPEALSEFVVTLEYIAPIEQKVAQEGEKEGE